MSKRFGRNQKRKLLEELQYARQFVYTGKLLFSELQKKVLDLENEIDDAKRIVGHNSILFPPETIKINQPYLEQMMVDDFQETYTLDYEVNDYTKYDINQKLKITPLPVLLSGVKDKVGLGGITQKHFYLEFKGSNFGYTVDHRSLMDTPKDIVIRRVSNALAQSFTQHMGCKE